MLSFLKNLFSRDSDTKKSEPMDILRKTGSFQAGGTPVRPGIKPAIKPQPVKEKPRTFNPDEASEIVDGGPGKNILNRKRFVREDTGTHETLTILDDSLIESDDKGGIDPYNTGQFDRSKTWEKHFNK